MNKKNVLILCTGNSCRSIMAEALINANLGECVFAQSSGVKASGTVNPNAKALLESKGLWKNEYHSKTIETVLETAFDLVVTVCDHANESCPVFPNRVRRLHAGFDDPPRLALASDSEEEVLECYRRVRDEIRRYVQSLPGYLKE